MFKKKFKGLLLSKVVCMKCRNPNTESPVLQRISTTETYSTIQPTLIHSALTVNSKKSAHNFQPGPTDMCPRDRVLDQPIDQPFLHPFVLLYQHHSSTQLHQLFSMCSKKWPTVCGTSTNPQMVATVNQTTEFCKIRFHITPLDISAFSWRKCCCSFTCGPTSFYFSFISKRWI